MSLNNGTNIQTLRTNGVCSEKTVEETIGFER